MPAKKTKLTQEEYSNIKQDLEFIRGRGYTMHQSGRITTKIDLAREYDRSYTLVRNIELSDNYEEYLYKHARRQWAREFFKETTTSFPINTYLKNQIIEPANEELQELKEIKLLLQQIHETLKNKRIW